MPARVEALPYASGPRATRRNRRLLWAFLPLIALAIAGIFARAPLTARYRTWAADRAARKLLARCLAYQAPAEQVVYEEDPTRAAALLRSSEYRTIPVLQRAMTNTLTDGALPFAWQVPVARTPQLWREYAQHIALLTIPSSAAVIFFHERVACDHKHWLVCVRANMTICKDDDGQYDPAAPWGISRFIEAETFPVDPHFDAESQPINGGLLDVTKAIADDHRTRRVVLRFSDDPDHRIAPPFPMRIYAGQPDSEDVSAFTFRVDFDGVGKSGTIAGHVGEDGSVWFSPDVGEISGYGPRAQLTPATHPAS